MFSTICSRQVVAFGSSFQCQICFQIGHSAAECLQRHHYDFQLPTFIEPQAMADSFSSQPLPASNSTQSLPFPIANTTPVPYDLLTSRLPSYSQGCCTHVRMSTGYASCNWRFAGTSPLKASSLPLLQLKLHWVVGKCIILWNHGNHCPQSHLVEIYYCVIMFYFNCLSLFFLCCNLMIN